MKISAFSLAILLVLMAGVQAGRAEETVDVELVLAVDASGSVNPREYQLQLSGIANAFRDPSIKQAIVSGRHRRIAVSLLACVFTPALTGREIHDQSGSYALIEY